jgi:hypothetical protein
MKEAELSSKLTAPFWAAFRKRCHKILEAGYAKALPRIRSGPSEETDITGYICEGIEEWLRENPKEAFAFYVKDDPPLANSKRTGKRRFRTDILIGYASGSRPEFLFESKRLKRPTGGAIKYCGSDGMGCFISGRYAGRYNEAGMIGYIQTDSAEYWMDLLQTHLQKEKEALGLISLDKKPSFVEALANEWASTHKRPALGPVTLFHILLDCIQLPQS